ncbi:unnamed protein product [Orchesella dallaii]|uniref:ZZ-type domain-containing protein n=1 Tax=Orchesella dallaii TaxID=48710 RepID=A0ABP1RWS0_9HEXA
MESFKSFKCLVCLRIPDNEIFQCKNGHSICHNCVANSPIHCPAPECGILYRMGKVRNLALESLLDPIDFECIFKAVGCTRVCKRADLNKHIEGCQYGRQNLLLCKMIGYETCQFLPQSQTRAEILEHFRANHDDVFIQNGKRARIRLEDFVSVAEATEDYWWTPILINFENNETGPLFLILGSTNAKEKLTSWMCLLLWADKKENEANMFAEFSIQSVADEIPELKWTLPATHIQKAKPFLDECFPWKVRTAFLTQHYLNGTAEGRSLVIKVAMLQGKDRQLKVDREGEERSVIGSRGKMAKVCKEEQPSTSRQAYHGQLRTSANAKRIDELNLRAHSRPRSTNLIPPSSESTGNGHNQTATTGEHIFNTPMPVSCDGCNMEPIRRIRYKCTQCEDFDLCSECVQEGAHEDHIFVVIRNAFQNKELISSTSKVPKLLNKEVDPGRDAARSMADTTDSNSDDDDVKVNVGSPCKQCDKHDMKTDELLYRCLTCPEYFVCSECFDQHEHSHKHFFAMTRNRLQWTMLDEYRSRIAVKLRSYNRTSGKGKSFTSCKRKGR